MKTVIKKQFVHIQEAGTLHPEPLSTPEAGGAAPRGPAVRVVEFDGSVRALEITCACGEVTLVELELETNGARPATAQGEDA